jgi:hypothetical protein
MGLLLMLIEVRLLFTACSVTPSMSNFPLGLGMMKDALSLRDVRLTRGFFSSKVLFFLPPALALAQFKNSFAFFFACFSGLAPPPPPEL